MIDRQAIIKKMKKWTHKPGEHIHIAYLTKDFYPKYKNHSSKSRRKLESQVFF